MKKVRFKNTPSAINKMLVAGVPSEVIEMFNGSIVRLTDRFELNVTLKHIKTTWNIPQECVEIQTRNS